MQNIRFIKRLETARTPTKGTEQAAGFDLYAAEVQVDYTNGQLVIDTGLKVSFENNP